MTIKQVEFLEDRARIHYHLGKPYGIPDDESYQEVMYDDIGYFEEPPETIGPSWGSVSTQKIYVPEVNKTLVFLFNSYQERSAGPNEEDMHGPFVGNSPPQVIRWDINLELPTLKIMLDKNPNQDYKYKDRGDYEFISHWNGNSYEESLAMCYNQLKNIRHIALFSENGLEKRIFDSLKHTLELEKLKQALSYYSLGRFDGAYSMRWDYEKQEVQIRFSNNLDDNDGNWEQRKKHAKLPADIVNKALEQTLKSGTGEFTHFGRFYSEFEVHNSEGGGNSDHGDYLGTISGTLERTKAKSISLKIKFTKKHKNRECPRCKHNHF